MLRHSNRSPCSLVGVSAPFFSFTVVLLVASTFLLTPALHTIGRRVPLQTQLVFELRTELHKKVRKGKIAQVRLRVEPTSMRSNVLVPFPEIGHQLTLMPLQKKAKSASQILQRTRYCVADKPRSGNLQRNTMLR